MDINLQYSFKQLQALNLGWEMLDQLIAKTPQEKAMVSCVRGIKIKLENKQNNLQYKYFPSSTYRMALKYHEAFFLELYWRETYRRLPLGYERIIMNTFADTLHRKLL